MSEKEEENGGNLANDGVVVSNPGIAVREEIDIDDGDQPVVEDLHEVVGDEIGAVRTQSLVI